MSQTGDVFSDSVTMAVSLIDKYTGDKPFGAVSVSLKGEAYKPVKNPSGYYVFLNIPVKTYIVQVRSDYYLDNDFTAILTPPKPGDTFTDILQEITREIPLDPTPAYPFPNGATLIRGIVKNLADTPVPNASVTLVERALSTFTNKNGEYVFYLNNLTSSDISDGGFVETTTNSATTTMTISAQAGGAAASVMVDEVAEGASKSALAIKLNITS